MYTDDLCQRLIRLQTWATEAFVLTQSKGSYILSAKLSYSKQESIQGSSLARFILDIQLEGHYGPYSFSVSRLDIDVSRFDIYNLQGCQLKLW